MRFSNVARGSGSAGPGETSRDILPPSLEPELPGTFVRGSRVVELIAVRATPSLFFEEGIFPREARKNPMTRSLGNLIADSLTASLSYAERLLNGIPAERFARFATPGGVVVVSNHPAFIYGHLSLYAPRVLQHVDHPAPAVPDSFELAFSKNAVCRDDPDGDLYPPMDDVVAFFREGYRMAIGALRNAPDDVFDRPNPAEGPMRAAFPTIGSMHGFYCGGHMMMHLGQLSAWRRMEGLSAA